MTLIPVDLVELEKLLDASVFNWPKVIRTYLKGRKSPFTIVKGQIVDFGSKVCPPKPYVVERLDSGTSDLSEGILTSKTTVYSQSTRCPLGECEQRWKNMKMLWNESGAWEKIIAEKVEEGSMRIASLSRKQLLDSLYYKRLAAGELVVDPQD